MSVLPLNVRYRRKGSRLSRLEVSVETIIRNHWKVKPEDSVDKVVIICSWENMYGGLLSSLDGCVLVSLHRNPCWNIWNSTSSEVSQTFALNIWDTSGHLNITWCLQSALLLVGSQQSVLEAGCALLTTSPSTELVFETDFFWFLEIFEGVILWHEYDVSEIESNLVNLSSSAAASDLTAALSKRKRGEDSKCKHYSTHNLVP